MGVKFLCMATIVLVALSATIYMLTLNYATKSAVTLQGFLARPQEGPRTLMEDLKTFLCSMLAFTFIALLAALLICLLVDWWLFNNYRW